MKLLFFKASFISTSEVALADLTSAPSSTPVDVTKETKNFQIAGTDPKVQAVLNNAKHDIEKAIQEARNAAKTALAALKGIIANLFDKTEQAVESSKGKDFNILKDKLTRADTNEALNQVNEVIIDVIELARKIVKNATGSVTASFSK